RADRRSEAAPLPRPPRGIDGGRVRRRGIGLPMFFEIGLVLLLPVIVLIANHSGYPLMRIAIPALAGLSVLHGLVPPHPGPLVAIASLHADLGLTLLFGLICAIPTVIVAGPVFGNVISRYVSVPVPSLLERRGGEAGRSDARRG